MPASRERSRPLAQRIAQFVRRSWRGIALGVLKWLLVVFLVFMCIGVWTSAGSGHSERLATIFVIAFFVVSITYLIFVSSRTWLDIPGIDASAMESADDGAPDDENEISHGPASARSEAGDRTMNVLDRVRDHARDWIGGRTSRLKGRQGVVGTIQVSRLKSSTGCSYVVNDSPLPVLRAEAPLVAVREIEGEDAFDERAFTIVKEKAFSVPACSSRPAGLSSTFNHVGVFLMSTRGIRVYDLTGLFSRVCGPSGQWRVRVVPNIYRLVRGIPKSRRVIQASLGFPSVPADALDYDRVRDYRLGDPLKIVHWKLVAHGQGELYTKLFETATKTNATLLVDTLGISEQGDSSDIACHLYDTMLEGGFSLLENAREHGISGSVRFTSRNGSLVEMDWRGAATLGWFVEAAQRPSRTDAAAGQSVISIQTLQDGRTGYAIFATSCLSRESVEQLIACHNAGVPLLVVHALPPSEHPELSRQLSFDAQLRKDSLDVIDLKNGSQIVEEVAEA